MEQLNAGAYTVRVNGEEKYFTTTDRLLIDTLTAFTQGKVNVWPLFSAPANFLRESVSRSPLFMARNLVRDSMSVWVNIWCQHDTSYRHYEKVYR